VTETFSDPTKLRSTYTSRALEERPEVCIQSTTTGSDIVRHEDQGKKVG